MAARVFTSAGTDNLWSNPLNWDGGVTIPQEDDSVTIPTGQTCEYDYNSAYTTGIAGITITGTLSLTRTAGTYRLFMKAGTTIGGTGTFDCGTSDSPIPFAAKHTITGGAAWFIQGSGGLTMTVYGAEPTIKYVKLTGAEASGSTVLEVDTNVTGDIWADGDTVRIDNVNRGQNSEERVIATGGIAAGAITITAGLTAAKIAGTVISLITRNIKFIGVGASGYVAQNFASGKLTVDSGQWTTANYRVFNSCTNMIISGGTFSGNTYGLNSCTGASISGGTFSGNTYGLNSCAGASISGGTFSGSNSGLYGCAGASVSGGTFSGNYQGLYGCSGASISGGTFSRNSQGLYDCSGASISGGTFSGSNSGLSGCTGASISGGTFSGSNSGLYGCTGASISGGTFSGNGQGLYGCTGASISGGTLSGNNSGLSSCSATIKGATFSGNNYDLSTCIFDGYNISLTSATPNINYIALAKEIYSYIVNYGEVAGAYKAWTKGGVTTLQTTNNPTGFTSNMSTVLENAANEGYWQKEVLVGAGASVTISMALRKSASMTYLPRIIIFDKATTDPFAGGIGLNTFTMTDSTDTWEYSTYVYTNTGTADVTLVIRSQGMNATGTMLSAVKVDVINVDLTSALSKLDDIKAKTDTLKNPSLLIDGEIIV